MEFRFKKIKKQKLRQIVEMEGEEKGTRITENAGRDDEEEPWTLWIVLNYHIIQFYSV